MSSSSESTIELVLTPLEASAYCGFGHRMEARCRHVVSRQYGKILLSHASHRKNNPQYFSKLETSIFGALMSKSITIV